MGPGTAALIGQIVFWSLLFYGWLADELGPVGIAVFISLWLAGWLGLPFLGYGAALFSPYLAVLDIVLALMTFKGDVQLR